MAVFLVKLFKDSPSAMSEKTLSQSAEAFANKSLSRARTLTFISVGIGILWIWAYLGDALINTSLDTISVALSGAAYLLIGSAVGFVWRAVREIQRNPSPIYFERTMEKVNFFWLATCIGFIIILIGNLL
jgi:magnesium-transporting ATPase (P-type)